MSSLITFITEDNEKVSQIREILGSDFNYQISHLDLKEYQGTENYAVREKFKEALSRNIACPIVIDLTSVVFNAFVSLPGTLITSFLPKLTSYEFYKLLDGFEDKSAYALYTVGLLEREGEEIQFFHGAVSGNIVPPSDRLATGWEAIFQPDGHSKPYSELSNEIRKEISERRKALRNLKTVLISEEFFFM